MQNGTVLNFVNGKGLMNKIELHLMYKSETGLDYIEWEFEIFGSRGQCILEISDKTRMGLFGNKGVFGVPDFDYIEWLENKVIELKTNKTET